MSMTAEIISVGTELLLGNILNTNAQYLSRELAALGITVQRESTIGDNHGRLADFVNEAKQRCDLLVFTGGLGPTADDLTKETVAACYGDTLEFDPVEWEKIVAFFTRTHRETTPNNCKQAMVPVHGHKVINNHGTAPGAWFEQDGHCAVLMPGVPHEMKAMWEESVRPLLMARQNCTLHSVTLRVLGGESDLEYRVRHLLENANPTAAIYCKTGECEIRITARAETDTEAEKMCRAYATKFYDLLGDAVYDVVNEIQKTCQPDDVQISDGIALVAAVGRKMPFRPGVSGKLFKALGDNGINIRTIAQGADETSIIVGVENKDFESAIRVLYDGFAG